MGPDGPLCRLASAESDTVWADDGPSHSPEDLRKMVQAKQITDDHARGAHQRRGITIRPDGPGCGRMGVVLPDDQLEAVKVALDRIRDDEAVVDPDTGQRPTVAQQRADALVSLAGRALGADGDPDRATVVLHADVALLTDEDPHGHASLVDGTPVAAETVRRHCCDGRVEWAIDGPDGVQLGIGRASRVWSPWLSRLIRHRDGGHCRFTGCPRPIHHIHHIEHWIPSGRTDTDNGIGLCWTHHHLVHEGGWKVAGNADIEVTFTSPTGRELASRPRRLDPALKRRLKGCTPHLWDDET